MKLYFYSATIRSIYDGDTLRADIDLGFDIHMYNQQIRLYGLDTPEIRGEERSLGLLARQFVVDRIPPGTEVKILTYKDSKEKFGRYLATIFYGDDLTNLNEELLSNNLAEIYGP
jgi:micrococcal nuclease